MRKVANVKQVGFNPRFLERKVVCHSKKLTEFPGKKCREVYPRTATGMDGTLTLIFRKSETSRDIIKSF
jgi:hypothetical protein